MKLTGKRHPFHAKFSIGYDHDGHLLAAKVELVSDGGWSLDCRRRSAIVLSSISTMRTIFPR